MGEKIEKAFSSTDYLFFLLSFKEQKITPEVGILNPIFSSMVREQRSNVGRSTRLCLKMGKMRSKSAVVGIFA